MKAAQRQRYGAVISQYSSSRGALSVLRASLGPAVIAAVLLAIASPAVAQEQTSIEYNVIITDEATGFLADCTEVRVYSADPVENVRLLSDPVVKFPSRLPDEPRAAPANPMFLLLAPGRYELVVCVAWLRAEVHYMYFVVEADRVTVVDVKTVEFPEELMTY